VLAAFLPVHLYMFHYVTNEGLASVLMLASIYICLRLVRSDNVSITKQVLLGSLVGLAILAKITAVLLAPVLLGILVLQSLRRRAGPAAVLRTAGVFLLAALVFCGGHFFFLWSESGNPFVGGVDAAQRVEFWQDPGQRTTDYFLSFGSSLVYPRFAGFDSFADGLYSTLWGDALSGGMGSVLFRPPWNEERTAAGYVLSLLPTLGMLFGAVAAVLHWYRRRSLSWLLILGSAFAMLFGLIHHNLFVPAIASPKIHYSLSAMVCLCLFGSWGLDLLAKRSRWIAVVIVALLVVWAGNSYLTYWIDRDAPRTAWLLTRHPDRERAEHAAIAVKAAAERRPADAEAQFFLGVVEKQSGDRESAASYFEATLTLNPRNVEARLEVCPNVYRQHGVDAAIEVLEGIPPGTAASAEYFRVLGQLYEQREQYETARDAYRHALGVDPLVAGMHQLLGDVYARLGDVGHANEHQRYALGLGAPSK